MLGDVDLCISLFFGAAIIQSQRSPRAVDLHPPSMDFLVSSSFKILTKDNVKSRAKSVVGIYLEDHRTSKTANR